MKTHLYNPIQLNTETLVVQNSIHPASVGHGLCLVLFALVCFALSPSVQGQLSPPPDGGYPNNNTAEGEDALYSLDISQGLDNTAIGFEALFSNTTGIANTANGSQALFSNIDGNYNTANGYVALQTTPPACGTLRTVLLRSSPIPLALSTRPTV